MACRARAIFLRAPSPANRSLCGVIAPERRGRPIRPDRVDRVRVDRDQAGAGFLTSGRISRDSVGRVESRVVAKLVARLEAPRDPFGRRVVRDMAEFEDRSVRLGLYLLGVSAVNEQGRRLFQHDREPRRAREIR